MKFNSLFLIVLALVTYSKTTEAQIRMGVFADCQYCDCETGGSRFYRNSLEKLATSIDYFNRQKELEFVVNLGDLIDRDFTSFQKVKPILAQLEKPVYHLPGNHDWEVEPEHITKVPEKLGLSEMYYSFSKNNWLFIFLDGTDISGFSPDKKKREKAKKIASRLEKEGKPNYHPWNAAIGAKQLCWFKKQLKKAEKQNQKVAVFCHYPLLPFESHALWNYNEVLAVMKKFNVVKLWMNGHNHAGNYDFQNNIHFVTLKGMVETETENAFAEVLFTDEIIEIKGFGQEQSRILDIRIIDN